MAEGSSELNEGTGTKVSRTDDTVEFGNTTDNTDLVNRSTENFSSGEEFDTNTDETSDETEKIRTDIVETRSQMSETIDAIQEKLSFANLSGQVKDEVSEHINSAIQTAKDSVYDATLGKVGNVMNYVNKGMNEVAGTSVMKTVGKNPLAISLIGLGLGLLYMNRSENRSQYRYNRNRNDYDFDSEEGYNRREFSSRDRRSTFAAAQNKVSDAAGRVGETVSGAAGAVGETVSGAAGAISDTASGAAETVSDVAGKAYKQVGNLGSQVKDVAGSAQDQYEYYIEENPLAVGAVALALGAAVGMSIPSTRFEGELMGETRDNLMQKAQETARGTIDKVKSVAGEVTEKVRDVAADVAQTVKDNAGDVIQPVKDEAKKQGIA